MQSSAIFNIFLPVALVIVMLGLGLSLKLQDFSKVVSRPKVLVIALVVQILVLPVVCFGIVSVSSLPPAIAVGMMLLAASPGGPSAVLYTHLAKGDTALSLTLTAINSLVALVSVPLITNFSLLHFYGAGHIIPLQIEKFLQFFALALVPASIGIAIQHRYPAVADRMEGPVKLLAMLFLAAVVLFAVVGQWDLIITWGRLSALPPWPSISRAWLSVISCRSSSVLKGGRRLPSRWQPAFTTLRSSSHWPSASLFSTTLRWRCRRPFTP